MNKLRNYLSAVLAILAAILGALLFRKTKQTEQAQFELANAIADKRITEADHDREIAKKHANDLVATYERMRKQYDERSGGSGGDTKL